MRLSFKAIVISLAFSVVAGCSTFDLVSGQQRDEVREQGDAVIQEAKEYAYDSSSMARINYVNRFYVPTLQAREKEMPGWFFKSLSGNYKVYTIGDFMALLQRQHGVNARFLDGINPAKTFSMVHDGTVGEALRKVELATAYGYEVEGDVITWSKYVVDFIDISAVPGISSYRIGNDNTEAGNQQQQAMGNVIVSDTGIADDGSYASIELEKNDVMSSILATADLLKSEGGKISVDTASTSLIVRDFPENVRRIREYVESQNKRLTAKAVFDISIIDYVKRKGDELTVNYDVIKNELASSGVLALTSGFGGSVVGSSTPTLFSYTKKEGKYAGAAALLQALKERGVVFNVVNPSIMVTNNRISKIIDSNDRSYLASAGTSNTANVGSTDILTPGIVKTGMKLWVLADINLDTNTVVGTISNAFSDLTEISSASSGNSTIQTPQTSTNEFEQSFHMKDGETVLLGRLGSTRKEVVENTSGSLVLGGQKGTTMVETETLILVTPRIIRN